MSSNSFEPAVKRKKLLVIVDHTSHTSIHFTSTVDYDVYKVKSVYIFKDYIRTLSKKYVVPTKVIIIYSSIDTTLKIAKELAGIQSVSHKEDNNDSHKHIGPKTSIRVSTNQHICLAFDLYFVISSSLLKPNVLSYESISTQQILRFTALNLSASMAALPDVKVLDSEPQIIVDRKEEPQSILQESPSNQKGLDLLDLYIPKNWDSWSKIQMLSKYAIYAGQKRLLSTDEDSADLDRRYAKLFSNECGIEDIIDFFNNSGEGRISEPSPGRIEAINYSIMLDSLLSEIPP